MSAERDRTGDGPGAGLDALLWPCAVAIVGASDDPTRIGGRPLRYLREAGFARPVYPVNPKRETVQGLKAYASVGALPGPVDCAVIAVPAPAVVQAVRDCADHGVRAAIIFSSGFAEVDAEGATRQAELAAIARETGLRIVGPNCLGLFNPAAGFYPAFTSTLEQAFPRPGKVAIVSQSGAYGSHLYMLARKAGLGIRYLITTGNECDVQVASCLGWLAEDEGTEVVLAYTEGVRDAAAFLDGLKALRAAGKPVVVMKVGRSEVGAEAVGSHTAALTGSDAVYDAVLRQYGAYRARTTEELIDLAYACSFGVYPRGKRVGLVTISGGVGILMADAAADHGLDVAPMPEAAQAELKALLPYAAVRNPVDITAQAFNDLGLVSRNLEVMLRAGDYDSLVIFMTSVAGSQSMAAAIRDAVNATCRGYPDRLTVLSIIAPPEIVAQYEADGYPVFEDPTRAVAAIARLAAFGESFAQARRGEDAPALPPPAPAPAAPLNEYQAKRLLADAGLPVAPETLAADADTAAAAVDALDRPAVLKIVSPDIQHKTEIGGVVLDVRGGVAARAGFDTLMERARARAPAARLDGVLVAPMAETGVEAILGVQRDPVFGPVVMLGLGGVFVEVLRDVTFRLAPFDAAQARRMIAELKGAAVFDGVRGAPPADVDALAEALAALSRFAAANARWVETIDVNPFVVLPQGAGALALDALIAARAA